MIFWGGLVVAWRRGGAFCKALGARLPGGGIVCSRLSASRSHRRVTAGTPTRRGPTFVCAKVDKTHLGLCPKTPFSLSCGWIRTMRSIVRTAPQIRSQGACGAFYFGCSRNRIKNQPYKRRLAPDPGGRRPSGRGVPTRWGSRGPPRVTFGYFSSQKSNPPPGRRAVCHPVVTPRRRQAR